MFERFTEDARAAVQDAITYARDTGQTTVEAEHLLLGLCDSPELRGLGLDRRQLGDALAEEERQSLAAVGVFAEESPPMASGRGSGEPGFGSSSRLALQRGVKLAQERGSRRFGSHELLGGVLAAEHGRVPRVLELAGIDIDDLRRGSRD
jgi:ATP-dependent Clp protease ATP-binding subunit ClpA